MKKMGKVLWIATAVVVVAALGTGVAAATDFKTPAEIVAEITGRDEDSVVEEKQETGKTYGTIAAEAGVLDAFRDVMQDMREDRVADRVESGDLTQEEADAILERVEERQEDCDGTGSGMGGGACDGSGLGLGLGGGQGKGQGQGGGCGMGSGAGQGRGQGQGDCDGSCES